MRILSNDYSSNLPNDTRASNGGTANFASRFSDYVINHSHEWIGIIQETKDCLRPTVTKKVSTQHAEYHSFRSPRSHLRSLMRATSRFDTREHFQLEIEALRRFIRRTKPDILFINGFPVFGWMLLEAAFQENLPIVIQHAGIARIELDLYPHIFTKTARSMLLDMEQSITKKASKQIFLNKSSFQAFCKQVISVPKNQSVIIPLPFSETFANAARDQRKPFELDQQKITIGCVARWDRIKNHKAILDLAKEIKKQRLPWSLKTVTTIPESKVQIRLKKAYQKSIEVVPPIRNTDLVSFYQSVDLLILPSLFDVSPTVVMEAALLNKGTLISPTVGWVSEYQETNMNDWIINFSDPKAVIKRIQKILKKQNISKFRTYILSKHNPNKVFSEYIRVFKSVL
jgi:glycosyltransferase involved in cell wall biosynthesis